MGAWGVGLWSDDTACDVRGTYREALEDGLTDEEAKAKVLAEFAAALQDQDEAPVVWIALAMSQRNLGRLDDDVRDAAVAAIDSGGDLSRWAEDSGLVGKRKAVLAKVRTQLVEPQPARKKVRKPARRITSLLPGDVLAYRAPSGRNYLLAVRTIRENRYGAFPVVRLLDYEGMDVPDEKRLRKLGERPKGKQSLSPNTPAEPWWSVGGTVRHRRGHDYGDCGFELIGRLPPPSDEEQAAVFKSLTAYAAWEFWQKYLNRQDELLTERQTKRRRDAR